MFNLFCSHLSSRLIWDHSKQECSWFINNKQHESLNIYDICNVIFETPGISFYHEIYPLPRGKKVARNIMYTAPVEMISTLSWPAGTPHRDWEFTSSSGTLSIISVFSPMITYVYLLISTDVKWSGESSALIIGTTALWPVGPQRSDQWDHSTLTSGTTAPPGAPLIQHTLPFGLQRHARTLKTLQMLTNCHTCWEKYNNVRSQQPDSSPVVLREGPQTPHKLTHPTWLYLLETLDTFIISHVTKAVCFPCQYSFFELKLSWD